MDTRRRNPAVVCTSCHAEIHPEGKSPKRWQCEKCGKRHPNLKLHWRILAVISGVVPLLVSLIGVLAVLALPWITGHTPGRLGSPNWLHLAAFTGPALLRVGALLFVINAVPLLIVISAFVIPRPWNDRGLKILVLLWLALMIAGEIFSVAAGRWVGMWGLAIFLPVLLYFLWLTWKTGEMVPAAALGKTIGGLRSPARRAEAGRRRAGGPRKRVATPGPVQQKIDALRARVRQLVALHALSWIVGALITVVLVLGWTDYVVKFQDRGIRVVLSLAVLGVFGWTCYRYLYTGLTTQLHDVDLARRLQQWFPALGDGLASAVEFLEQSEDDPTAGSVALRRAVITQTTAETEPLDFRAVIEPAPTVRAVLSAGVICLMA